MWFMIAMIFLADRQTKDLAHLKSVIRAGNGEFGGSKSCHGKSAEHKEVS